MLQSESSSFAAVIDEFCAKRARLECELIGALLLNRRRGMQIIKQSGLHMSDFEQPDCRCIFLCVRATLDCDLIDTLILARKLLSLEGLWDNAIPAGSKG